MASTSTAPPETAARPAEPLRMTYDEYRDWYDKEAGRRGEWVDGEVIVFMTTTDRHRRIVTFLITVLNNYLGRLRAGELFSQDFELRTREGAAREPDIFVVLVPHLDRLETVRVVGAADLVIEVISPDSVKRDRRDKADEYATAGIPEFWLVDPREERETIEVLTLDPDGYYVAEKPDANGRIHSLILPGVWANAEWLAYGQELPDPMTLAMEMIQSAEAVQATPSPES